MAKEVIMPALGMAQETGTLLRWIKAEGETVEKGEPLMEVATDKTDVEIESPASGILGGISAQEGEDIPVGQVIAYILAQGESVPAAAQKASKPATPAPAQAPVSAVPAPVSAVAAVSPVAARMAAEHGVDLAQITPVGSRIQKEDVQAYLDQQAQSGTHTGKLTPASPKARRLAAEQGVDLADISGSGPEGAVLAADVLAYKPAAAASPSVVAAPGAPVAGEAIPMSRMWQVMAKRLTESWTTVPHFFLAKEADATQFMAWRSESLGRTDVKITYTDLLVKVVATALTRHPRLNASWIDGKILANGGVNVGIAVAVGDGLLVPVIHGADRLGLAGIAARRAEVVDRAQSASLAADDLSGGTFTISNLGMAGIDSFSAIVNPPQAAILAVGRIMEKVVPVHGQPAVRPTITFNISCDHRVVDGFRAAQFLSEVVGMVENPLRILD